MSREWASYSSPGEREREREREKERERENPIEKRTTRPPKYCDGFTIRVHGGRAKKEGERAWSISERNFRECTLCARPIDFHSLIVGTHEKGHWTVCFLVASLPVGKQTGSSNCKKESHTQGCQMAKTSS
jgi:hypothetical protein